MFDVCTLGISHAWEAHTANANERTFGGSSFRFHSFPPPLLLFHPPVFVWYAAAFISSMALVLIAKHICQKSSVNKNEKKKLRWCKISPLACCTYEKAVTKRWKECCSWCWCCRRCRRKKQWLRMRNKRATSKHATRNNNKRFFVC